MGTLVFGWFANQSFLIGEGNNGRGDSISEFIRDYFNATILKNSHAWVSSTQIDTNNGAFDLLFVSRRS